MSSGVQWDGYSSPLVQLQHWNKTGEDRTEIGTNLLKASMAGIRKQTSKGLLIIGLLIMNYLLHIPETELTKA